MLDLTKIDLTRPITAAKIRRQILYVPPSMPAADLLIRMQSSRNHMALVVDEYGGTDGLVTIEDLVEQIVGDFTSLTLLEVARQTGPLYAAVGHSLGGAAIAVALARGLSLERSVLIAPFSASPDFVARFAEIVNRLPPRFEHRVLALDGNLAARERIGAHVDTTFEATPETARGLPARLAGYRHWLKDRKPDLLLTYNWGSIEFALANLTLGIPHIHGRDAVLADQVDRIPLGIHQGDGQWPLIGAGPARDRQGGASICRRHCGDAANNYGCRP